MKKALSLITATLLVSAGAAIAAPPQQIDVRNLPGGAKVVDEVVIPVPSEIFAVLDKQGRVAWSEVLRDQKAMPKVPPSREQIALLLGTVIAEGFIAVEAENTEEVKNIGRSVLNLSEAINVKKAVVPRSKAIIEGADKKAWQAVRQELDKAQHDVQEAMRELNDEALAQLVSLGGWLRGTEALATVVKRNYKPEGAELLHQPILLEYFDRRLGELPKRMRDNPLVGQLKSGLLEIRPLVGDPGVEISEKTVGNVLGITEKLVASIREKAQP